MKNDGGEWIVSGSGGRGNKRVEETMNIFRETR